MLIVIALLIVITATAVILNLNRVAQKSPLTISTLEYLNTQAKYQTLLLAVAVLVLLTLYVVNAAHLSTFLALGNTTAPATAVSWLGITKGEAWLELGMSLAFFITLATSTFVYLQFRKSAGAFKQLSPFLAWVLLFSLTNSFCEEVVYRLGVIVPLAGTVDTDYILLLSAVAFGAPHLRGMPNGIMGALMAGLLGWLLAKSVMETNGLFWAWFIHFLQDIVIFSALVLAAVNQSRQQ
jgi:hypothetical protein